MATLVGSSYQRAADSLPPFAGLTLDHVALRT